MTDRINPDTMPERIYVEGMLNSHVCGVHTKDVAEEFGLDPLTEYVRADLVPRQAVTGDALLHFKDQRNKCCTYCADEREAFERDGAWWHEVARGGDLGDTEPCKAYWYHRAMAKAEGGL